MRDARSYLFLKQSANLRSYFGELCLDVPESSQSATVYSEIDAGQLENIRFVPGPKYHRHSFAARVLSWLAYFAAAVRFSFSIKGRPLLFIVAQPPFLPLLGYLQKKLLGRPYVVWIDDVYPDVLARKGIIRADGWLDRTWGAFNRITLSSAAHVFTISPQMLSTVRKYLASGASATIVPTWVDTDAIYPIHGPQNAWARQHGLEDKFVVMYSGNFGQTHDVDTLLAAARELRTQKDVCFVLIGAGSKWEEVRKTSAEEGDPNVVVLPWQPSEVLAQSLSSADIAFVSLDKGMEGISMPSKTYYAMSAGTAILASCLENSDLGELVTRCQCGVVVQPGSVSDLVSAVEYLRSHPGELASYKRNSRTAAVESYSRQANVEVVRRVLEMVV